MKKQFVTGLEHISKVGIVCTNCDTEILLKPDNSKSFPPHCLGCSTDWTVDKDIESARKFVRLLRLLNKEESPAVRVKMVFNDAVG